jgi:hypothetical protein
MIEGEKFLRNESRECVTLLPNLMTRLLAETA